jgi:hypothetical protein
MNLSNDAILFDLLKSSDNLTSPGEWTTNCAGEIFVPIEGEQIRIGHFQGCAKEARAVCDLVNSVSKLKSPASTTILK